MPSIAALSWLTRCHGPFRASCSCHRHPCARTNVGPSRPCRSSLLQVYFCAWVRCGSTGRQRGDGRPATANGADGARHARAAAAPRLLAPLGPTALPLGSCSGGAHGLLAPAAPLVPPCSPFLSTPRPSSTTDASRWRGCPSTSSCSTCWASGEAAGSASWQPVWQAASC